MESSNNEGDNATSRHLMAPSETSHIRTRMGYIYLSYWPKGPHGNLQMSQVVAKTIGWSLQTGGKALLPKTFT